jgi:hypothetical protein
MSRYFTFLFLFFSGILHAQTTATSDSLRALYGHHKRLPTGYELPALTALSYYPELRHAHIRFVVKKADLPYASRPAYWSLITPFVRKRYVVTISDQSSALREPTLLKNLSLTSQIGALGHELGHTSWYLKTGKLKIIRAGLHYSDEKFKEKFEKMTDCIAIHHGLGSYILEWNQAVYSTKLKDGNRSKIYYSPAEIAEILLNPHKCNE